MTSLVAPYTFGARIVRFRDADTVVVDVDRGWDDTSRRVFRLPKCNAMDGDSSVEGAEAAVEAALAAVNQAFPAGLFVLVSSLKPGKDIQPDAYGGRWVGNVVTDAGPLHELLIRSGWAARWDGRSQPKPVPAWPRPAGTPELADLLAAVKG